MTAQTKTSVPLSKLIAWRGNVRKTDPKAGLSELTASIEAHGLLQSLVVQKDKDGKYAVVAGRRRLLAMQSLAKAGKINQTFPVLCSFLPDDVSATEISLVENFQREPMHPADEFEAFQALIDGGLTAADVSARFGVTEVQVEKRLKLANVSPALIKEYRDGNMTLNHMMAFAVTTDRDAQERVWKELPTSRRDDPDTIRDLLTEGEINAKDRRVKFVTLAAYEKAGGAIRRDLFSADEDGAFIIDKELLAKLVTAKLEKVRNTVSKEGFKWAEAVEQIDHSELSKYGRLYAEPVALPAKKQAELDKLNEQLEVLYDKQDEDEADSSEIQNLQAKIAKIEDRPVVWGADTLAISGAIVSVGYNGKVLIERGLVRPEDKPLKARPKLVKSDESGNVIEITEGFGKVSAGLTESLTTHRTAALTAALGAKPGVALAVVVHTMALQTFYNGYGNDTCLKLHVSEPYLKGIEGSRASEVLVADKQKWQKAIPGKPEKLWAWCLEQKQPVLLDLLAFCTANSVDAVQRKADNPRHARFGHAAEVAKSLGLDMTEWFTATAENYFRQVSKIGIMEALKEAKIEITPQMEKAKKGELAEMAGRLLGPTKWLPELLRGLEP